MCLVSCGEVPNPTTSPGHSRPGKVFGSRQDVHRLRSPDRRELRKEVAQLLASLDVVEQRADRNHSSPLNKPILAADGFAVLSDEFGAKSNFWTLCADRRGGLWMGSTYGLMRWDGDGLERFAVDDWATQCLRRAPDLRVVMPASLGIPGQVP